MAKKSNFPFVSIIIPTQNRSKSLYLTLESIYKMSYPKNKMQVIVIDNASTDSTLQMLQRNFNKIQLIKNKTNEGFAPALNQGIKVSDGKYILVTNDDVIFDKNCLAELVKAAETNPKAGILGGKMFFVGKKQVALRGFKINLWLGYHPYDFENKDKVREMDVATGGCMLIKKSSLKKSGYFDEGFFFCGEDYDLCFRMKAVGFKIMYVPTALLVHKFLNSGKRKDNFQQLFAHYRGKIRFMLIHASVLQMVTFFPAQFLIGPIFSYQQSRQFTFLPMLSALGWNLKNISSALNSRSKVNKLKKAYEFKL